MEMLSLITGSSASDAFKADVEAFLTGRDASRIELLRPAPRVKVGRLLAHLLHAEPALSIERVRVQARSGCSDFTGLVHVETASETLTYEFTWCCAWRAEQEGYTDFFGFPDQIRAAREFDWQCFKEWRAATTTGMAGAQLSAAR